MKFSIIIPSYNQDRFIEQTLKNVVDLKNRGYDKKIAIEIIVYDNLSNENVQNIIKKYESFIDVLKIEQDNGQFDAINKGLNHVTGNYWTWLNTDDLIDFNGFFKIVDYLADNEVDYIYGNINTIDVAGKILDERTSGEISLASLTTTDASITQPGSFFRTAFTNKIGPLKSYRFAFDYEYILRILKNYGKVVKVNAVVAQFRYYEESKSGSKDARFLIEQLEIAKLYGCKLFSKLSLVLRLRILKRKFVN
jgi:glycosyltransferase involved in cell wall biosynthesis